MQVLWDFGGGKQLWPITAEAAGNTVLGELEFKNMTTEIESFIHYLEDVKQSSKNTVVSYQRDLRQLKEYLERQGIEEPAKVTRTCLN